MLRSVLIADRRSPNGWNVNVGNWVFAFGVFVDECAAARLTTMTQA